MYTINFSSALGLVIVSSLGAATNGIIAEIEESLFDYSLRKLSHSYILRRIHSSKVKSPGLRIEKGHHKREIIYL